MPKNRKICEPQEPEDWCFDCKDGGELLVCDHKNCGKVYHIDCVEEEDSFFQSGKTWFCGRHYCFSCHKSPKFYCLGCPHAVCKKCYDASEFAIVRGEKGLCSECLEIVWIIEQNLEQDSEGNKISLNDIETYETLFKEYWGIIKVKEGLTNADVCAAQAKFEKGKNSVHQERSSESEEEQEKDDDVMSYNSDTDDTCNHEPRTKRKRSKSPELSLWESKSAKTKHKRGRNSVHQRRLGKSEEDDSISSNSDKDDRWKHKPGTKRKSSKSQEFIGWASNSLICFLISIGKDIIRPLTRWDVTSLIHEYIVEKNLRHPKSNEKFIPDEKLLPIFGKKIVSENRIYSLLGAHFAESLQQSAEEKNDDENKDNSTYEHLNGQPGLVRKSPLKKRDLIIRKSCFASINAENIKLIYLKQSLVQELSKQPESFKDKVIGTFVKVRADPKDHRQRTYHLVRVIGVNSEFLLQVSFMPNAIPISDLSDDDFTEQECEALQQKVKDGMLQKLTIVELQEKARSLHEDITKHWIAMRLIYLQKRIEYANDKGRHREKIALIDEKVELEQPCKQEQLLQQEPLVCPELIEAEYDPEGNLEPDIQGL